MPALEDLDAGVVDVPTPEHGRQQSQEAQLGHMGDDHDLQQPVVEPGGRRQAHTAPIGAGVGDRDRVAGDRVRPAAVQRDRERRRAPLRQRAQRGVGIDQVAAHEPGAVGDPVGVGIDPAAGDPHEGAPVDLAEVQRAGRPGGQHLAGGAGIQGDAQGPGEVVAPPPGQHAQQALAPRRASATAPIRPSPPKATAVSPAATAARASSRAWSRLRVASMRCSKTESLQRLVAPRPGHGRHARRRPRD